VTGNDCIDSCKSNDHAIMTTTTTSFIGMNIISKWYLCKTIKQKQSNLWWIEAVFIEWNYGIGNYITGDPGIDLYKKIKTTIVCFQIKWLINKTCFL
jgi:hypothetical protein